MKFKDKVWVVTGGGNGMGRELVLQLLLKGARVAAVDIDGEGLEETRVLAGQAGDRLSLHILNITDQDAVEDLPGQVIAEHGAVDGLINNAGIIQPFVKINKLDYDAVNRVMDINFYGVVYLTKAFLPHLLERPEAHIANVSSMGVSFPCPDRPFTGLQKPQLSSLMRGFTLN